MKPKMNMNMFDVEVFEQVSIEYRHNLIRQGSPNGGSSNIHRAAYHHLHVNGSYTSKCDAYLFKMWDESHD